MNQLPLTGLKLPPVPQFELIAKPAPSWRRIEGGGPRIDQRKLVSSQRGLTFLTFETLKRIDSRWFAMPFTA